MSLTLTQAEATSIDLLLIRQVSLLHNCVIKTNCQVSEQFCSNGLYFIYLQSIQKLLSIQIFKVRPRVTHTNPDQITCGAVLSSWQLLCALVSTPIKKEYKINRAPLRLIWLLLSKLPQKHQYVYYTMPNL